MRTSVSIAVSVALLVFAADTATAQTPAPAPMSTRALRQQDRAECSKQVNQHQANAFLECMMNREAARKAAATTAKAAKRAECKTQADERNMRLARRLRFVVKCTGAK
jgi:hypothetical protein